MLVVVPVRHCFGEVCAPLVAFAMIGEGFGLSIGRMSIVANASYAENGVFYARFSLAV